MKPQGDNTDPLNDKTTDDTASVASKDSSPKTTRSFYKKLTKRAKLLSLLGGCLVLAGLLLAFYVISQPEENLSTESEVSLEEQESKEFANLDISEEDITRYTNTTFKGSIAFSPDRVWVANGHGLLSYHKETSKTTVYTEVDGLFSTKTVDVAYFEDGIWVASDKGGVNSPAGVSRLDLNDDSWRTYTSEAYDMGRLRGAEFSIEEDRLVLTSDDRDPDNTEYVQTAKFDTETRDWDIERESRSRPDRAFTSDQWESVKADLDPDLRNEVAATENEHCADREFVGNRQDQLLRTPLFGGVAQREDATWYGCLQGFIRIDHDSQTVEFLSPANDSPALIYDVLTAKRGQLFAHTNLGLGIYDPKSHDWTKVRDSLPSYNGADFDWWNSAVWIDDKIYFLEFEFEDPSTVSDRVVSLWLYNTAEESIREVTPEPQQTLQDAYHLVPHVLRRTSDGESLMYQSGQAILVFTPSVPQPRVVPLDYSEIGGGPAAKKYWGYTENNGTIWYLTDAFLGKIESNDSTTKIKLPDGFDGSKKHVVDVNDTHVVVSGGERNDYDVFTYNIETGDWSNNLLDNVLVSRLSTSHDRLLVNDGRFDGMFLTNSSSEDVTEIDPGAGDEVGVNVNPGALMVLSLENGLTTRLDEHIDFIEKDVSHIFYDQEAVWVRHGLSGFTRIDN